MNSNLLRFNGALAEFRYTKNNGTKISLPSYVTEEH